MRSSEYSLAFEDNTGIHYVNTPTDTGALMTIAIALQHNQSAKWIEIREVITINPPDPDAGIKYNTLWQWHSPTLIL